MLEDVKKQIEEKFGFECSIYDSNTLLINGDKDRLKDTLVWLKENGFDYPYTVTVVDYTPKGKGFQVNYIIENISKRIFAMLRIELPAGEPKVDTASVIYPQLQPHEREAWEMFGIEFTGHPRLEVMLLPDWAKGMFPLRKSYKLKKHSSAK